MRYSQRKEFPVDPGLFLRSDTVTALKIHDEYVRRHAAQPGTVFFEADRVGVKFDALWHEPETAYDQYTRRLEIPAITKFERNQWRLTQQGLTAARPATFWLSHLSLIDEETFGALQKLPGSSLLRKYQGADYFPTRGDMIFFNGYRYMVLNVVVPPESFWQQTNVWLGLTLECVIPPRGDAKPLPDLARLNPAEVSPVPGSTPATPPTPEPWP